ncbi:MAG: histidine phosphatase family protein [Rhizobiaceae bacterium]|nr:histidine phosphatase family protein [Rhizobiaceae bacterium]
MSRKAYYITHPQVNVDPEIDVPKWGLSKAGKQRIDSLAEKLAHEGSVASKFKIVSSDETKAIETAEPIANVLSSELIIDPLMGENDRSATGFLPPEKFEQIADQFFANPSENILGWESAGDAQERIVARYNFHRCNHPDYDLIFVGHGAVGTLLYCYLAGEEIDRKFDQTGGGGNFFKIDLVSQLALSHWRSIEHFSF